MRLGCCRVKDAVGHCCSVEDAVRPLLKGGGGGLVFAVGDAVSFCRCTRCAAVPAASDGLQSSWPGRLPEEPAGVCVARVITEDYDVQCVMCTTQCCAARVVGLDFLEV